jgi:hypothetical protein
MDAIFRMVHLKILGWQGSRAGTSEARSRLLYIDKWNGHLVTAPPCGGLGQYSPRKQSDTDSVILDINKPVLMLTDTVIFS